MAELLGVRLFDRERELQVLEEMFDRLDVEGGALVVRGEPGIGKSALLKEAGRRGSDRGMLVLRATGVQSEARMPFAGLHQLLRPILPGVDDLCVPQRDAMRAAFGDSSGDAPDLFLIALSTLELLSDAAAVAPILILAEDAQWLDPATCDVLTFVGRRLESDPILLFASRRDGVEGPLESTELPDLRLTGLDEDAAASLMDAHATDLAPAVRERLLSEARGNPLALVELPIAWNASLDGTLLLNWLPLTTRLEHAFAARATTLSPNARALLLVAALSDSGDLSEVLAAASSLVGEEVTVDQVAPAVAALLIEVNATTLMFRHPLVRSALHQAAGLSQRHAAHAALACVLVEDPDRRAWHRAASIIGGDEGVAEELEKAAERAHHRGALVTAATALERAARLSEHRGCRARRLLRAAELAVELGLREMVIRLLHEADLLSLTPLDTARRAWIVETLDPGIDGDPTTVLSLVAAADVARTEGDPDLALNLLSAGASNSYWADRSQETHDQIMAVAQQIPVDPDDPRLMSVLAYAAPVADVAAAIEQLTRWIPGHTAADGSTQLLGNAAFLLGAHALSVRFLTASIERMREQGRLVQLAQALVERAWCQIHLGQWVAAMSDAQEASRLATETAQPIWQAGAQVAEAMLAGLRGNDDQTLALAAAAESVVLPAGSRAVEGVVQLTRGVTALGAGRHAEAYEHLERMLDPSDAAHHRLNCYWAIANLAEAAVRIGRRDEARALLEGLECRAALTPSPLFDHVMRHARAVLADDAEAEALFQLALAPEANTGPFQRARVELAYAMWLRRQRRGADARAPLRAARDTFDALGALPWGQAARQELRATGETSRGRTPDVLEQLTPQELQIAQMAASGLSNREIGQTLYLSHRTIGSHLYRIFPKLGVASRAELRDALPDTEPANDVPPPAADRLRRQSPDSTDARGLLFNAVDQQ